MRVKDENKRIAIYHAAMEVVNQCGVDNASMSKIAKSAGVSSSTIYVYFENKADMINKIYLLMKQEACSAMFKDLTSDMDFEVATKSWMRNYFYFLVHNPDQLSFLEQFHSAPTISETTREEAYGYFLPIITVHQKAVEQGAIKDYPAPIIVAYAFDPMMSLARTHLNEELEIDESLLETVLEMSWAAIRV